MAAIQHRTLRVDDYVLPLAHLTLDSRQVAHCDGFVALPGLGDRHGLDFLDQAIARGASAVLVEAQDARCGAQLKKRLDQANVVLLKIKKLAERLGDIASAFYAHPSKQLKVIGVTGTDGKTSVSHFIAQLLRAQGEVCGVMGTLGSGVAGIDTGTLNTTPDVISVHRLLAQFVDAGAQYATMEVSSHALAQGRVDAVHFEVAVFTNLGRDHLDYHESLDAYGQSKARLFQRLGLPVAVINVDDDFAPHLLATHTAARLLAYGRREVTFELPQYRIARDQVSEHGLRFDLCYEQEYASLQVPLIGHFNIDNLAASLTVMGALGWGMSELLHSVATIQPVAGRAERFFVEKRPTVVVDYAHTPQSLAAILSSVRPHCRGRLCCVFGCGGDRDSGKRAPMAEAVEQGADLAIVTDDNPRSEAPEAIVQDILKGFSSEARYFVVHDRAAAIERAIAECGADDWVVVAGKGHETEQWVAGKARHFSDREVVQSLLNNEDEQCA